MVQHAVTILLGIAITIISFIGAIIGSINGVFEWILVGAGILALVTGFWGLISDVDEQPRIVEGM